MMNSLKKSLDPTLVIRALACIAIIWYHLEPPLTPFYVNGVNIMYVLNNWGGTFVFIFYLLSGYGIGYGFFSKKYQLTVPSILSFFIKRFFRLAPAYYTVILICYGYIYKNAVTFSWADFIRYITFRANTDPYGLPFGGNHAMVSTEMQFYLVAPFLFALLLLFIKKIPPFISCCIILFSSFGIKYYLTTIGYTAGGGNYMKHTYGQVLGNIDLFVFGMFLSYLIIEHPKAIMAIKKRIPVFLYVGVVICWLAWANWFNDYFAGWTQWPTLIFQRYYILPFSICMIVGGLIIFSSVGKTVESVGKITANKVIRLLVFPQTFLYGVGVVSYGIYLWQYPVIYFLFKRPEGLGIIATWPAFFCRLGIVTAISLLIALVSYTLIERPSMRLGVLLSSFLKSKRL